MPPGLEGARCGGVLSAMEHVAPATLPSALLEGRAPVLSPFPIAPNGKMHLSILQ